MLLSYEEPQRPSLLKVETMHENAQLWHGGYINSRGVGKNDGKFCFARN